MPCPQLDRNQLHALPRSLFAVTSLTSLSASGNSLTALPGEVGGLTRLASLALHHNRLSALPTTLSEW